MNAAKGKILGSRFIGLYCITNDELCFVPKGIEDRALKMIEKTLDVKTVKTSLYESSLLAIFAKMNNKFIVVSDCITNKELEILEKEIKVKKIKTEQALGNLIEINDFGAIVSKSAEQKIVEELKKEKLNVEQMNLAKTDAIGSALVATNNGFVASQNISTEEAEKITKTLTKSGGTSTANAGDHLLRNSIIANTKGFIAGEDTTGFELNRIDEALEGK